MLKHLEPGVVVSATRIEPPLHPDGPEKILVDFGIEPEEFKEQELMDFLEKKTPWTKVIPQDLKETTEGIFAPWAIYKSDFQSIGGHDPLFAPQSKEDSDIFNRFVLNGYNLIQTWKGFVYHMTCRGSRFADGAKRNPDGQVFMKNRETDEWLKQNEKSTRNFIRKWGHMVKHDSMMKPIIPPKYDIGFKVAHCDKGILRDLEPWCSDIYGDWLGHKGFGVNQYIEEEQKNTLFNIKSKIHSWLVDRDVSNNIVVEFDAAQLTNDNFQFLTQLPEIIHDSGEAGEMEYDIFKITIKSLETYEKELIICEK
jgi:hypothetical protein